MEMFDEDLIGMVNYTDETVPAQIPEMKRGHRFEKQEDAIPTGFDDGFMKRLTGCAKWSMTCGGIAALLWWFQMNDLMAIQASYPCILACALLAGYGVGKNVVK